MSLELYAFLVGIVLFVGSQTVTGYEGTMGSSALTDNQDELQTSWRWVAATRKIHDAESTLGATRSKH